MIISRVSTVGELREAIECLSDNTKLVKINQPHRFAVVGVDVGYIQNINSLISLTNGTANWDVPKDEAFVVLGDIDNRKRS